MIIAIQNNKLLHQLILSMYLVHFSEFHFFRIEEKLFTCHTEQLSYGDICGPFY